MTPTNLQVSGVHPPENEGGKNSRLLTVTTCQFPRRALFSHPLNFDAGPSHPARSSAMCAGPLHPPESRRNGGTGLSSSH
jgi:hypothetical protein